MIIIMKYDEIKNKLKEHGLKATIQRTAIYTALLNSSKHPTADEIYTEISDSYPGISLSTVYNTLEKFVDKKLIFKAGNDRGKTRYDAITEKHHHIINEENNQIIDYYNDELDEILDAFFVVYEIPDFNINEIKLQIKGNFLNSNKEIK